MSKLMLVDDEVIIASQLEKRLTAMGYEVVGKAFSGEESVEMAKDLRPDLILMDIVMPGKLDGIDAAETIKSELGIPVIFLSAHANDEYIKRAKKVEPYGYVLKPFQEAEIRTAVEIALYKKDVERELRESREALKASHRFLEIANKYSEMTPLLEEFLKEVKGLTGCGTVGIRLLDQQGNIPYEVYEGFSREFYESESPLSIKSDQCMCINVVKGTTDPNLPFYTEGGSFYINGTTRFLATVPEGERGKTRNACNEAGYESVALVPIRLRDRIFGLIHVADSREDKVHLKTVAILEQAAIQVGTAIERVRTEESLRKAYNELELSLEERETVFRSVNDAIITVDTEAHITGANEATKSICGVNLEEVIGKSFGDVVMPCERSCHEVLSETLRTKSPVKEYHLECRHRKRPAKAVVLNSSALFGQDNEFMGAVLVIRDITRLRDLEQQLSERHQFHNIVGRNRRMQEIYTLLENLADTDTTILFTGESGTGKEVVAKALHYSGIRAFKPMVKVNCSALAENLLESELFGHVKGAFTGAQRDRVGRFQAADGGTILLDEIGDISPIIQRKLLRVLQEKEFERVGDSTPMKVDVRVIATTNRNLKEKVESGEFRDDLYYRLKVIEISLPPLRERTEDILLLADHFIDRFNKRYKRDIGGISNEVLDTFMNYPWPGNVRELEHAIEHAFILSRSETITVDDLSSEIKGYAERKQPAVEKRVAAGAQEILKALEKTGWNKAKAARLLGISRRTIYRKIQEYNITEKGKM